LPRGRAGIKEERERGGKRKEGRESEAAQYFSEVSAYMLQPGFSPTPDNAGGAYSGPQNILA